MGIEDFRNQDKEAVISLLKGDKEGYEKKLAIWDWQYHENPYAREFPTGRTMSEEGRIVGFSGYIPVELRYNGTDVKGVWGIDLVSSPDCRGKGYGFRLVEAHMGVAPLSIVLGSNDNSNYLVRKAGCKVNTDIEEFVYTNRPDCLRDLPKKIMQYLKMARSIGKRGKTSHLRASITDPSSISADEIDLLWKKVEGGYGKIVKRSYSYIKWKYGSHPLNEYQFILITNGGVIVGIGIFRKDARMSRLVDYVGPSKGREIKQLIIRVFKKQCSYSHLLECTSTDEEFKTSLEQFGFRKYEDKPSFHVHSNIENDQDQEKNWFIMTGDSDNDV